MDGFGCRSFAEHHVDGCGQHGDQSGVGDLGARSRRGSQWFPAFCRWRGSCLGGGIAIPAGLAQGGQAKDQAKDGNDKDQDKQAAQTDAEAVKDLDAVGQGQAGRGYGGQGTQHLEPPNQQIRLKPDITSYSLTEDKSWCNHQPSEACKKSPGLVDWKHSQAFKPMPGRRR